MLQKYSQGEDEKKCEKVDLKTLTLFNDRFDEA